MKNCLKITSLAIGLAVSSVSIAEGAAGSGPNPYKDCGIGAGLFPNTAWAAITSNVIWDLGTTAVTSATSSPETCNGKSKEVARFIIDNVDILTEQVAMGAGEHVAAALSLAGCNNPANAAYDNIRTSVKDQVLNKNFMAAADEVRSLTLYRAVMASSTSADCKAS